LIIYRKSFSFNPVSKIFDLFIARLLNFRARQHLAGGQPQLIVFSFDYIGNTINHQGIFEREELDTLMGFLKPFYPEFKAGVCLDIGANIGNHSVFFSQFFEKIHSFEPERRTYQVLKLNAQLKSNIETHEYGFAEKPKTARLSISSTNVGEASVLSDWKSNAVGADAYEIELKSLDGVADQFDRVVFVKIDVEGLELNVLQGGEEFIRSRLPIIVFEQHKSDFDSTGSPSVKFLQGLDYVLFTVQKSFSGGPLLAQFIKFIAKSIRGSEFTISDESEISPSNYPMIIAIPNRLSHKVIAQKGVA
jgi:FkbM family methyltransferase